MKQAKDIEHDDMAEVVFLGVMMPRLARWIDEQGWLLQPWPSGNESATEDEKYHSFIVTPRDIPGSAVEGLTPEQAAGYAEAFDEALETGVGVDEHVEVQS